MQEHWLMRPANIKTLWRVFIAILALTVAAEFFVEPEAHFGIDGVFGFNAWYGFLACAALILMAKLIGIALKRPDTYYEPGDD